MGQLEAELRSMGDAVTADFLLPRLEKLSDTLGRAWGACNHLKAVKDSEPLRKAVEEIQPENVAFGLRMSQSLEIYRAFKSIRASATWESLSDARKRIIETEIRDAELSGVALQGESKERFNVIQQTLAVLATNFSNNVLDATKAYSVRLTKKEEVFVFVCVFLFVCVCVCGYYTVALDMPAWFRPMQRASPACAGWVFGV